MAASGGGWNRDLLAVFGCNRRTDRECEEVVPGSSDASDSGESEEVVQLQNEALEAIKNKDVKALREILSRADPNLGVLNVPADKDFETTVLHLVADSKEICEKSKEILKLVLEYEPKLLDKVDKFKNTALKLAAEKGHYDVVKMLISYGADINKFDTGGDTPLHCAIRKKNVAVVELLLKNGSDTALFNKQTETPLHNAVTADSLEIVELLLQHHASPNTPNRDGHTPLRLAEMNNLDIIAQILKNPASARTRSTVRGHFGFGAPVQSDYGRDAEKMIEHARKALAENPEMTQGSVRDLYITIVEHGSSAAVGPGATCSVGARLPEREIMGGDDSTDGGDMENMNKRSESDLSPGSVYKVNADNSTGNIVVGDNARLSVRSTDSSPVSAGVSEEGTLPISASNTTPSLGSNETMNIAEKTSDGTQNSSKGAPSLVRVPLDGGLNNPNSRTSKGD